MGNLEEVKIVFYNERTGYHIARADRLLPLHTVARRRPARNRKRPMLIS